MAGSCARAGGCALGCVGMVVWEDEYHGLVLVVTMGTGHWGIGGHRGCGGTGDADYSGLRP